MNITLIIVSVVSLLVAAVMSAVAWRLLRHERLRSAARVAALAREIHDVSPAQTDVPGQDVLDDFVLRPSEAVPANEMFATAPRRSRLPLVATGCVFVVGMAAAAALLPGGAHRWGSRPDPSVNADTERHVAAVGRVSTPVAAAPLELKALGHERDRDGLTVRGVLRNPTGGAEASQLTAVVVLFNRDGSYLASGQAPVQAATLAPGSETTFVVTVSGAPDVERYRVSFRTEREVVPHVDQRS